MKNKISNHRLPSLLLMCLFALSLSFTACKKDKDDLLLVCEVNDPTTDLPWLKEKIEQSFSNITLVEEYSWNNQTVFLVNQCADCADSMDEIYTCEGDLRCSIGGIAGFQCPGFDQAVLIKKWH